VAESVKKPSLGELVEAERLIRYLEVRDARNGTVEPYSNRIVVRGGVGEEQFDPVRVASGVRWKRTR